MTTKNMHASKSAKYKILVMLLFKDDYVTPI